MKKLLSILFLFIPVVVFAQSYTVSEVYVEMNIRYDTYYAEVNGRFGEVETLYKKARFSDIGHGEYVVQLEHVTGDLFKIVGTGYILEIKLATQMTFSRFDDCILDVSGFSGTVTKKSRW
jgi:hypothetical protein